ncbi:MAG TPA: mechanosensitive ion channel domain-containing protein [Chitinophagaceae bacterium]|nr:mechanosensitive ion channel domain-containing protein [Chitinophagaceae bacterium]
MARKLLHTYLFIVASSFCVIASAQQDTLVKQVPPPANDTIITDTVTKEVLIPLRQRVADEIKKNIDQLNRDKIAARQNKVLDDILEVSQKANDYLGSGIDTAGIASQLDYILRLYDVGGDGVFTNKGTTQTERNLATTSSLLRELLNRAEISKHSLESYHKNLVGFQNNIDSLASDTILIELPSDSISLLNLISKISVVTKEMRPADTLLKKAIQKVQLLQTRVNFVTVKLEDGIEQIEKYREDLAASLSDKETVNLWEPVAFRRPMKEILFLSKEKAKLVLSFYSKNNSGKIVFLFLLIIGLALFLRTLKKKLHAAKTLPADQQEYLVLGYPLLSSVLIVLCVFQFIFREPPFVFSVVLWSISAVILTLLFRNFIIKYWLSAWFVMLILFFLAMIDNLILQSSRIERYGMLLLSLTGATYGLIFLIGGRRKELKEKGIRIFMGFFILMELISAIANIYGRYNFAKSFLTSGIFGLVNAILFFWVIRMVNEMLTIAARVYKTPDKKTLFINFEKVGQKVPPFFYYLLVVGWFILFGRSFYFFRKISDQFTDFMVKERSIGESTFTIQSVFIFFLILVLSGIISSIVTFFASSEKGVVTSRGKKGGLGSWLLLIRISIITIGVLLAFAAAGIPMDRLAIILGALSVGIGFGLQSLINNLVSGLILAFEKPINVGDVVEFGGQSGTMKSIGFRSSIITTWEGADVIIPNGNLLNEQMINWTMGNSSRRVEIVTGVAYGTDLEKTKKLLLDLLAADKRIVAFPKPSVLVKELNSGAIELRVLFWIEHYSTWIQTKSDMIETIDEAFKKEGIKIPNPSQDLNIRSFVSEVEKKK